MRAVPGPRPKAQSVQEIFGAGNGVGRSPELRCPGLSQYLNVQVHGSRLRPVKHPQFLKSVGGANALGVMCSKHQNSSEGRGGENLKTSFPRVQNDRVARMPVSQLTLSALSRSGASHISETGGSDVIRIGRRSDFGGRRSRKLWFERIPG
jgi:hypothetical protein